MRKISELEDSKGISGFFRNWFDKFGKDEIKTIEKPKASANYDYSGYSTGRVWSLAFDGEKNDSELGPAINYRPDYQMLRIRSWQSYLESDITKTVIDRFVKWTIGKGLKLQTSPNKRVLISEGFNESDLEGLKAAFATVEARYEVFASSTMSSWNELQTLHKIESVAYRNARVGGDVLVVLRYVKKQVSIQLIDGQNVQYSSNIAKNGNRVIQGVEVDDRGRHVAFYVRTKKLKYQRISASPKGSRPSMAFMYYSDKLRCDSVRGMPLIASVLETLKKLDRYKEATVGSAEERAKVPYQIVHGINSTGENVFTNKRLANAVEDSNENDLPSDSDGKAMARTVAVSTQKQVFNMPNDSKLESLESKSELYFKDFYDTNFNSVCAAIGMPPNVAKMIYDDNFSASRAALKDWENTLKVDRTDVSDQFNSKVYQFWLWTEVMDGKTNITGLLNAYLDRNVMAIAAFVSSRWIGSQVPHIDPLKEAKAEREKLGELGKNLPLTTLLEALENLGAGEVDETLSRFKEELEQMKELGLDLAEKQVEKVST